MASLAQEIEGDKISKTFCWLNTLVAIRTEVEETVGVACAEIFLNSPNLSDILREQKTCTYSHNVILYILGSEKSTW